MESLSKKSLGTWGPQSPRHAQEFVTAIEVSTKIHNDL